MILELHAVKQDIKVDISEDDDLISRLMDQATAIVLDYLKVESDAYENEEEVNDFPDLVYAAIIRVIQAMYDSPDKDPLTDAVRSILHRMRDPAFE